MGTWVQVGEVFHVSAAAGHQNPSRALQGAPIRVVLVFP